MANQTLAARMESWISGVAHFFSNFTYLTLALIIYMLLSGGTWLALRGTLAPDYGKAAAIAYTVATGGDPYNYTKDLAQYFCMWQWIRLFHIISWLAVPVLIATAIEAAHRANEARTNEWEMILLDEFEHLGRELGYSGEELNDFIKKRLRQLKTMKRAR